MTRFVRFRPWYQAGNPKPVEGMVRASVARALGGLTSVPPPDLISTIRVGSSRQKSILTATGGGDFGSVDLTSFIVTTQARAALDYTAYTALDPRSKSAGWVYQDPVTGGTVIKLTDASVGTPGCGSDYGGGGPYASHAWELDGNLYVTVRCTTGSGGTHKFADVNITNPAAPTLSAWRTPSGNAAGGELRHCFSNNPETPQIFYTSVGNYIRKWDGSVWPPVEITTGNWPHNIGSSKDFLVNDIDDVWFGCGRSGTGHAWNSVTNTIRNTGTTADEWRLSRDGLYLVDNSGGTVLRTADGGTHAYSNPQQQQHNATMRGGWMTLAQPSSSRSEFRTNISGTSQIVEVTNRGWYNNSHHMSDAWVQPNVPVLEQYYAAAELGPGWDGNAWGNSYIGCTRLDGAHGLLLAGHYIETYSWCGDYWSCPWNNPSAGGHLFLFTSWMGYSASNKGSRYDLFAFISPRS